MSAFHSKTRLLLALIFPVEREPGGGNPSWKESRHRWAGAACLSSPPLLPSTTSPRSNPGLHPAVLLLGLLALLLRLPLLALHLRRRLLVAVPLPSLAHSHSGIPHDVPCGSRRGARQLCRAAEYVFPDPIPEFAEAETDKFRRHMVEKLSKKDIFGSAVEEVVGICTGILNEFLHTEYGGPGTLLVIPFIDMADTINERGLPGGPQAARAAVVWAQKHVDKDWKEWTGSGNSS